MTPTRLQPVDPIAEQPADGYQVSDRAYQFEVIPQVCLIADVCHFLRISESQFFKFMRHKRLALVELDRVDRVRRFTGESVALQIKLWAGRHPSLRRVR